MRLADFITNKEFEKINKKLKEQKKTVDYKFAYTNKGYLILRMAGTNKEEFIEQLFLNGYGKYENNIITIKSYPNDVYYFRIALVAPNGKLIKKLWNRKEMGEILEDNQLSKERANILTTKH